MHVDRDMMKPLRDEYDTAGMTTHVHYLDELVERIEDNNSPITTITEALALIETQANLDLYFQQVFDQALDYCEPETHAEGHIVYRCMLVDSQRELIVQPSAHILSGSDGMGNV